jgi:hypothetical protein
MIFPVKVPYQVTPDMTKYQGAAYNSEPEPMYLTQKKQEMDRFGDQIISSLPSASTSISTVCSFLERKDLGLKELALLFEEDIAILKNGILEAISFCFPSGFIPSQKVGMNFFDMHLPVADGERLRSASEKVTALISKEGSMFRRFVWTVTALPGLSQHPSLVRPIPAGIDDLYFRTETQTTVGLGNDVCLFFVKVDMQPLELVWADSEKRQTILASINSMSEATLTYKNLHQIKTLLNR